MVPQGPELCPWWLGGFMRRMFPLRVCDWPGPGAARLPVLILGLSLDPKPKVVRPKTKTYFTKKVLVRCHWHLIPTLAPRGAFWKGRGRSAPTRTLPKTHPLLSPSAEVSAGDSAAGPPGRDNLNLNIPYYSCIARSYYMHIYLAPKNVVKK